MVQLIGLGGFLVGSDQWAGVFVHRADLSFLWPFNNSIYQF